MRVKCRGFEGRLIEISAAESAERDYGGGIVYMTAWYDVRMRLDTGERVEIERVQEYDIEIINATAE